MKTIRRQLTQKLLIGFGLLLAGGGAGVYFSTRTALVEQFDETLRAKANTISSATEQNGQRFSVELTEPVLRGSDEGKTLDFFQLRRQDGTTIRRSKSLANGDLPNYFGGIERPRFWNLTLPSGAKGRAVGYAFSPRNSREGKATQISKLTIVAATDRHELDETLLTLALALLGCGVLLLGTTMIIVPRVLRYELAPLDYLAEQTSRINADSLSARFPTDSVPGELEPISQRLNDLLGRLENSFARERQFSADVAHELRTPIAELRSLVEFALKWPESRPVENDRDTLAIALQMEGIVVRLLDLVRSERGQLIPTREVILLAPLTQEVWQTFAGKAAEKRLEVALHVPDDATIETDAVLFRSIIKNLLDNAVEYTPVGGTIRLDSGVVGNWFTLRVTNTIEHFEATDLPKLFDRFWRKDQARSGTHRSGLGLPLARAFAQTLGCELAAALDGESRLAMTLSGPAKHT